MPVDFLGFTVWVATYDGDVDEYAVQVEDDNTVTCYIPSEVGKEFTIRWRDDSPLRNSVVACYMDGRAVGGKPSKTRSNGVMDGVYTSTSHLRRFQFSPIITTDDDDVASPDGVDPDLGCIQIEIHQVGPTIRKDRQRRHGQVHDVGPVHERSKKLGAHCVSLGEERDELRPEFLVPTYTGGGPYAVFKFFYRPIELLKARGIVPPPSETTDVKPSVAQNLDGVRREIKRESEEVKPQIPQADAQPPTGTRNRKRPRHDSTTGRESGANKQTQSTTSERIPRRSTRVKREEREVRGTLKRARG